LSVHAVAGSYTVLLGFDLDAAAIDGLLGLRSSVSMTPRTNASGCAVSRHSPRPTGVAAWE